MKKLFVLPLIFLALQSFTQEPYYDFKKFKKNMDSGILLPMDLGKQNQIISKDSLERLFKSFGQMQYSPNFGDLALTLPNKSKIYFLPQDNMPCIVPDLSKFNMPNAGIGIKITGMPPGSAPRIPLIPKEK